MPRLIVKRKAEVIKELDLKGSQASFSIGSDEENDLVIEDKRVSINHFKIDRQADNFFLQDLKSAFGTFVNGIKAEQRVELRHGDEIRLGDHTIVFDDPESASRMAGPETVRASARSFSSGGGTATAQDIEIRVEGIDEQLRQQSAAAHLSKNVNEMAPFYLLAIYGPYAGKRFQLKQGETRIGRDSKLNDIIIRENRRGEVDPSISRRHATIMLRGNAFYISDKRSKTRTFVNQMEVPEDGELQLFSGDEIEIVSDQQSTIFRFVSEDNLDFSAPKRAGVWSVRHRSKFLIVAAALAFAGGLWLLIDGWLQRSVLVQQPDTFAMQFEQWMPVRQQDKVATKTGSFANYQAASVVLPVIADFNGDGYVDMAMLDINFNPIMIDGKTRRPAWTINAYAADPEIQLVAADLNGDGIDDLLFVSNNGKVVAIDGKHGAEIWTSPFFKAPFSGPPVVADINGDGYVDVAIAEQQGRLHIGLGKIVSIEWTAANLGLETDGPLTVADLNQDGKAEILCGTERGLVLIVDGITKRIAGTVDMNGELNKARGSIYEENQIRFPVGVSDLNGDGHPDLVMSSIQGNILAVDGATKNRIWDATLAEGLTLNTGFPYPFALGDVTGNGLDDVVVLTENGNLRAYAGTGGNSEIAPLWQFMMEQVPATMAGFALSDVNKDRIADVAIRDGSGALLIVSGRDGQKMWQAQEKLAEPASFPLIADFSGDKFIDVVLLTAGGSVYHYTSNSKVPRGAVLWSQTYGQSMNTLRSGYRMPAATGPTIAMAFGTLLLLGAGVIGLLLRLKQHRPA